MSRKLRLPTAWYQTVPDLAQEWGCNVDRVYYFLDAGLISGAALVRRSALSGLVPAGPSPYICVLIDEWRALDWSHSAEGSYAELTGPLTGIAVDQTAFEHLAFTIEAPVMVRRDDVVVLLEQKEYLEGMDSPGGRPGINSVERRTLLAIIGGLIRADSKLVRMGGYSIANVVMAAIADTSLSLSDHTIATKVAAARGLFADDDATLGSCRNVGAE